MNQSCSSVWHYVSIIVEGREGRPGEEQMAVIYREILAIVGIGENWFQSSIVELLVGQLSSTWGDNALSNGQFLSALAMHLPLCTASSEIIYFDSVAHAWSSSSRPSTGGVWPFCSLLLSCEFAGSLRSFDEARSRWMLMLPLLIASLCLSVLLGSLVAACSSLSIGLSSPRSIDRLSPSCLTDCLLSARSSRLPSACRAGDRSLFSRPTLPFRMVDEAAAFTGELFKFGLLSTTCLSGGACLMDCVSTELNVFDVILLGQCRRERLPLRNRHILNRRHDLRSSVRTSLLKKQ